MEAIGSLARLAENQVAPLPARLEAVRLANRSNLSGAENRSHPVRFEKQDLNPKYLPSGPKTSEADLDSNPSSLGVRPVPAA